MKKILCFAPHPDDELLGCGGSLIKALKNGEDVSICYLTYGEQGSNRHEPSVLKTIRKKETKNVCKFLGIKDRNIYYLGIKDCNINQHDFASLEKIISLIRDIKPSLIYLPHTNDHSTDHQQAHKLVMHALEMAGSSNFKKLGNPWWTSAILGYEIWSPLARYQYSEDVSEEMLQKIEALSLYKSQTESEGNTSNFVGERASFLPAYRASMTLGKYREVFEVLRIGEVL